MSEDECGDVGGSRAIYYGVRKVRVCCVHVLQTHGPLEMGKFQRLDTGNVEEVIKSHAAVIAPVRNSSSTVEYERYFFDSR